MTSTLYQPLKHSKADFKHAIPLLRVSDIVVKYNSGGATRITSAFADSLFQIAATTRTVSTAEVRTGHILHFSACTSAFPISIRRISKNVPPSDALAHQINDFHFRASTKRMS